MTRKEIATRARQARAAQLKAMRDATSPLARFWAGSASASVFHHATAGAIVEVGQ